MLENRLDDQLFLKLIGKIFDLNIIFLVVLIIITNLNAPVFFFVLGDFGNLVVVDQAPQLILVDDGQIRLDLADSVGFSPSF